MTARRRTLAVRAYVCVVEVRLHLNDSHDLKGKRKLLHSLKAQLRQRFGASVAEVDGHDTWQRTTLVCALVGGGEVGARRRAGAVRGVALSRRVRVRARPPEPGGHPWLNSPRLSSPDGRQA